MSKKSISILIFMFVVFFTNAQKKPLPSANYANISYGSHERNILDIWLADSDEKTPLAIFIHGGGFVSGSKEKLNANDLEDLLESGISVAAINYRYLSQAPLPAAHKDALRALQYIRSRAKEWNIDRNKIAAFGSSAGAQISMWLAFSNEMAIADAEDPIERESSRLCCVATKGGQTTLNPELWLKWIPGYEKSHKNKKQMFGDISDTQAVELLQQLSALSIVSSDDPPIFMTYAMRPDAAMPSNPKRIRGWQIHHVIFGIKLQEKMKEINVESDLSYPGADTKYKNQNEFLKSKLL